MNIEPLSAVRRMGMVARACEVKTWTWWIVVSDPIVSGLV